MDISSVEFSRARAEAFLDIILANGIMTTADGISDVWTVVITDRPGSALKNFGFSLAREDGPLTEVGGDIMRQHEAEIARIVIDSVRHWNPDFDPIWIAEHDGVRS